MNDNQPEPDRSEGWGQPPQQPEWGQAPPQQPGWGQPPQQAGWGQQAQQAGWGQQAQQAGWGQPPAAPYQGGMGAINPYDSESTPILVTGILSLVVCGPIGIYAWIKGNDLKGRAERAGWPEPSTAKVGRILGIVGTVIGILQIGFVVLWLLLAFGMMGAASVS